VRGRTIASFSLVLAVLLLWPAPPSTADEAGTRLPFISFYTMVIDEPHHRVYVDGGPGTTGRAVLDFEGKQVAEDELPNPAGMVLIGDELFVLLSDAGTIEVIDVSGTELPLSRALEVPGFTAYGDMTFVDGHLWLEATRDFNEVLVEVDPRTGPTGGCCGCHRRHRSTMRASPATRP